MFLGWLGGKRVVRVVGGKRSFVRVVEGDGGLLGWLEGREGC